MTFSDFILGLYTLCLFVMMMYGIHRYWIVYLYLKNKKKHIPLPLLPRILPVVTVQLPVFNERYVVERLINAVCRLDYPKDKLEIQILDDSVDETTTLITALVEQKQKEQFDIQHMRRRHRKGYKAGALANGLERSRGSLCAVFDADFIPPGDFLKKTVPHFEDPAVGMVQTRWGHINADYSLLTRLQALFLDGHFLLEHTARFRSGAYFNFNGTAGIWRKKTILSAGNWSARTLTEDLDLSYRAQLKGWKFIYDHQYVCPAELPVDIHSFRSQQKRWAKGSIQVAKFILRKIWSARIPLHTKIESTVHLTANVGYLLTVVISILLLPSLMIRHQAQWVGVEWMELLAFVATTLSISLFYAVSQREIYPDWKWKLRDIPALLSFGIGMCVSNASAVWSGLMGKPSEFIRTPKFNIMTRKDSWIQKSYAACQEKWMIQAFFAFYAGATFLFALSQNNWLALPFIFLFVFGFSYTAGLSYFHCNAKQ